ncbi:MAG: DNA/RNA non-specific endonuclease [Spirochaeta sp.]|nr:DNA/RNA non-specific endonuclease [Spirochaeta sp.]
MKPQPAATWRRCPPDRRRRLAAGRAVYPSRVLSGVLVAAVLCLAALPAAGAQEIHSEHFPDGMPAGTPPSNDLVIRDLYALSANDTTRFADWVAYRLTPAEVYGELDLARDWRSDPWLDADETLEPSGPDDYSGAYQAHRYDRGHLAPLGSFVGSTAASSVNYYSNIVPQTAQLNRGPWRQLEERVRELVLEHHEVYVTTGPLYDGTPMPPLPGADEPHTVPTGFWKVVMIPGRHLAAFIMPQQGFSASSPAAFLVSVDEVEERTGLDLFPRRSGGAWDGLEARVSDSARWQ